MQEKEYSGSIWKPYSHIILNMCSTHQCYGLNIDLKLHNAYLRKLSTQFSISNSTLTQLLCRSAGAVSTTADILQWGRLQGLIWSQCLTAGWGEGADEAWGQPADVGLFSPLQPAGGWITSSKRQPHTFSRHSPSWGAALMLSLVTLAQGTSWWQDQLCSGLQAGSSPYTWSHVLPTLLECRAKLLTATASVPLSPSQWSQLQIAAAHLEGCDPYPDFSGALTPPANLAGSCHFEAGFSQEHSNAAPGAAEFQRTFLCCWNILL